MINPNKYFFEVVDNFEHDLDNFANRETLFNDCVRERFVNVLKVQTESFDTELNEFDKTLCIDINSIDGIKKLSSALKKLHKLITQDRMRIIEHLLKIQE